MFVIECAVAQRGKDPIRLKEDPGASRSDQWRKDGERECASCNEARGTSNDQEWCGIRLRLAEILSAERLTESAQRIGGCGGMNLFALVVSVTKRRVGKVTKRITDRRAIGAPKKGEDAVRATTSLSWVKWNECRGGHLKGER